MYSNIVYKVPGKHAGPEGKTYDWIGVTSIEEQNEKLKDGWFISLVEAVKGKRARTDEGKYIADDPETPENEAYDSPPSREELKQKAIELGIQFPKNIKDVKLSELIEAKLKD